MKKFVAAAVVLVAMFSVVVAAEINGVITKVDGNKITVQKMTKGKKGAPAEKEGDPVVLTVAEKVSVTKAGKKKAAATDLEGGLKNELFTTIPEKGIPATITIADDGADKEKVTAIKVGGGKKKKAATE